MAFKYVGNLNGGHNRTLIKVLLDDSTQFGVGDVVLSSANDDDAVMLATTGTQVLGVIAAIVDANGLPPSSNGASGDFVDTYTTGAANTTVSTSSIYAMIDVDTNSLYSDSTGGALNATTGSNKAFYMFDVNSVTTGTARSTLTENTASTTTGQFFSFGLDPKDTTRIIVKIKESILLGDSGI